MDEKAVRVQMKSKIDHCSGKDRAKFLKSLRERDKVNNPVSISAAAPTEMIENISNTDEVNASVSVVESQGGNISLLPVGFFDNEKDEMASKGSSLAEVMKQRASTEIEVLQSFFDEVDNIIPNEAKSVNDDSDDQDDHDLIENAIQYAYSAKVGNMMLRYDPTLKGDHNNIQQLEETTKEIIEIISQDHEVNETNDSQDVIQRFVGSSLAKRKRKFEVEEYESINLMDWTSRSIR